MSLFSSIQLRFGYRQVVAQNQLTLAQQKHLASVTDRGFLMDLWIKSLKQKADVILTFLWNHHRDVLQEKEVQHSLSHCFRFRQAPPVLLSFQYGNAVPHLTESMVSACHAHERVYVRSFLQNQVEMDEAVIDALFTFFFSYSWKEEGNIAEWKDLYSLFLMNRHALTEDGETRMHTLGLDLLPLQDIHEIVQIRSIERYLLGDNEHTVIMLLTEQLPCIKTAIAIKKRRQPGVDWFVKHLSTLILLKKTDILQALFEAYPELLQDPNVIDYFLPIATFDFEPKIAFLKEVGISLNTSLGVDALLDKWEDSLFTGVRESRNLLFLIGAGLDIWNGKHEKHGVSLLHYLSSQQKKRFSIPHIERDFRHFLQRNLMKWIEENEEKMGVIAKKAYRLYVYEHEIFS